MTARQLPIGYYLLNFETVLREVRARYGDLLHDDEMRVMDAFFALPEDARRLYVRMLTRKGPWFREDDLNYDEIRQTREALETLRQEGFCVSEATAGELIPLLVRDELAACLERFRVPFAKNLRRDALANLLVEQAGSDALAEDLRTRLRPARPLHDGVWSLVFFLFFGNGEQDLSSFVLADIGRIRYEDYALDVANRLFQSRRDLDFLLSLHALRDAFEEAVRQDHREGMQALTDEMFAMDPHPGIRQQRRYHRLLNDMGRAWERRKEPSLALACYGVSQLPPARERIARITGDEAQACELAIRIAETPLDLSEERFARVFLKRRARRVPAAGRWLLEHPESGPLPEIRLTLARQDSVELAALGAARAEGWDGFFAENFLWNAFFGLVFWDVLFAPVPGAFHHRFQSAPLDIGHPEFFTRRRDAIERRLEEIQDRGALIHRVLDTADRKWGIANVFLSWRHLTREMLIAAAERVPASVMADLLRTMAQSPRAFSSGFPDLFLFQPDNERWALWEVKGPGDSLRPEQERWLNQFHRLGCDARVAWVKWEA